MRRRHSNLSAARVTFARQRTELLAQRERDQRVVDALYTIALACRNNISFQEIFRTIYQQLMRIFPVDACYIAICDDTLPAVFRAAFMVDEGVEEFTEAIPYGEMTGQIVDTGEPILRDDLREERKRTGVVSTMFGNVQKFSRAWMGVPMRVGRLTVGVISLQSYAPKRYDRVDLDLLLRIADVIAAGIENVLLVERQRQLSVALAQQVTARTSELGALSTVAAAMASHEALEVLLSRALDLILPRLKLEAGNVRLLNEAGDTLVLIAYRGFSTIYAQTTLHSRLATSPLRSVISEKHPLTVDEGWSTLAHDSDFPRHLFAPFESLLSVPISIGERVLGTLSLFGFAPRTFSQQEINLTQAIGNQIAIAVERARLVEERERQIAELRALSAIGVAASMALDLPTLLRQVYAALKEFMPLDAFTMIIYDPEREVISAGLSIDEGETYTYWNSQPPPHGSLTQRVISTRQLVHFPDLQAAMVADPELGAYIVGSERPAAAWLGVPFFDHANEVIGVIAMQGYTVGSFQPRDELFLTSVARQVTLHVQNVRLLTQRERQIRELDAIGQIGQLINASFDLDEMIAHVYRTIRQITDAAIFYLLICEPTTWIVTYSLFINKGNRSTMMWQGAPPPPGTLSEWVLHQREPLLFNDLATQLALLERLGIVPFPFDEEPTVRTWVGVPLLARDGETMGVLSIQDQRQHLYDAQTMDFLTQIASHISMGIQKVRLFEEREKQIAVNAQLFKEAQAHAEAAEYQAQRMELVSRITALLSSRLDQNEIFAIAARELVQLFWAHHVGIMLIDPGIEVGTVVAEYPSYGSLGVQVPLTDNPIIEEFQRTRRPVCITSVATDPRARMNLGALQAIGVTALMIIPLLSRDRLIGSIGLDYLHTERAFSSEEQEVFLAVGTAVAAAIENARLFAAEQAARRTADTLREVARVLNATFDLNTVLELILVELQKVIPYDSATIMLLEEDRLRIVASRGWEGNRPIGIHFPVVGSSAGVTVQTRMPRRISEIGADETWSNFQIGRHIHSWLGVPLISRDKVLGVLNIDGREADRFTDRDVEVAMSFGNQAALALENARLYQESVTRVEQELEIAREIQRNLFPRTLPRQPGATVAAICIPARETGGDFYDVLELNERRLAILIGDVSGKSLPAAMLMAVARSVARSEARNHETPKIVMCETARWLIDDVPPGTFVALGYATLDLATRRLVLANAGQLTPILRHADGSLTYLEVPGPALPLGIVPNIVYEQQAVDLAAGDTLVFYTDGIVEAKDRKRRLFGFEWLEDLVKEYGQHAPADLIEHILSAVRGFSEGAPQHDDITIVVVKIE